MIMLSERYAIDPVMAPVDKLPANSGTDAKNATAGSGVAPFGFRLAVVPPGMGEHSKTYYTVKISQPTTISEDGTQKTITDTVDQERED